MHKCFCFLSADPHGVQNGRHEPSQKNDDSKINNMAKNLQSSLVLKDSSAAGCGKQPASQPDIINGRNGSIVGNAIYENVTGQNNKTPPVPARSTHTIHTPVPHPRTSLSVASRSQKAQDSPKPVRNARADATSSPTSHIRKSETSNHKPSSVKFSPVTPPSPRLRGSSLQKRSQSPMREQAQILSHVDVPQRVRTADPTGSTTSLKELPPHSPSMPCRGTPGSQGSASPLASQSFTSKPVPDSPQGHRKLSVPSKAEAIRALYTQSPSPLSGLEKESGNRQLKPGPGTAMSGLATVPGLSPRASPHSQRKTSCMSVKGSSSKETNPMKPYNRERKNSISEISDNEDELLEYHRWQREERLREQEMEKLVSDRLRCKKRSAENNLEQ